MADTLRHNDQPISQPSEDLYGFDPFARAIANGIRKMPAPNGYVLAINGPWGAGKSSVVNLVLHHLEDDTSGGSIKVLRFTPWWFRGEEALALAFFRELQAALNPSLRKKARKLLPKIGARLLRGGGLVGSVLDVAAGGGGAVASNAMAYLESLIETDDSLEALHKELRDALGKLPHRFLIVIDDIDRLTPDESLLIFKLVKSVGQLPNVLYFLAYDRALAEKILTERYPSEGPHFLEKIVQAPFEVPEPGANNLQLQLRAQIAEICGVAFADAPKDFFNAFYDVVTPTINTPRDLVRFANTIAFSWSAIASELHAGDFLALEALRLFRPGIYRALQPNRAMLCGRGGPHLTPSENKHAYCDNLLLRDVPDGDRDRARKMLIRIFPPLNLFWSDFKYGVDSFNNWRRDRRACCDLYFAAYFSFDIGGEALTKAEIAELILCANDHEFVSSFLRNAATQNLTNGSTKASLALDELLVHCDRIELHAIPNFLGCLVSIADEINNAMDDDQLFCIGGNRQRIQHLCERIARLRYDLQQRSTVLLKVFEKASLSILVHFSCEAYSEHSRSSRSPEEFLLCKEHAEIIRDRAINSLREAAQSNTLIDNHELHSLLYRWKDLLSEHSNEVRDWSNEQIKDYQSVLRFCKVLTTRRAMHSSHDTVSSNIGVLQLFSLSKIIDLDQLRAKCKDLAGRSDLPPDETSLIVEFLEAWHRSESVGRG